MEVDKVIKILIAEDEYIVSEDIIRGLKANGYVNFLDASDGEEALEMTCTLRPDIILMDIEMPKLNGIEAAARIQECCPTPIVIITAHESFDFIALASDAGVSAFLSKPPQKDEIEKAMIIAMARHADLMELRRIRKELEQVLAELKKLQGILPICSSCKKIRDDKNNWTLLEVYIRDHSEAEFSHKICPDCAEKLYPDFDPYKKGQD
jgi:YesN/AraC family two-component response regulator